MKTFAVALYDNEAESEDELTFSKNDILQILQFDYLGMEGWWLAKLVKSNAVGLAAGNRLKIIGPEDEKLVARLNFLLKNSSSDADTNKSNTTLNTSSSTSSIIFSSTTSLSSSASTSSSSSSSTTASSSSSTSTSTIDSVGKSSTCPSVHHDSDSVSEMSLKLTEQASTAAKANAIPLPPKKVSLPPKNLTDKAKMLKNVNSLNFFSESTENILNLKANSANFKMKMLKQACSDLSKPSAAVDEQEDDDYYDYDVPENNRPTSIAIKPPPANNSVTSPRKEEPAKVAELRVIQQDKSIFSARKSTSPTIDSGISTSSLISLTSELCVLNPVTSMHSLSPEESSGNTSQLSRNSNDDSEMSTNSTASSSSSGTLSTVNVEIAKKSDLQLEFEEAVDRIRKTAGELYECYSKEEKRYLSHTKLDQKPQSALNGIRDKLFTLKAFFNAFLANTLKRVKEEHACFHADLNVFNKFKNAYRQLKEFYLFYESSLNTLTNVYAWNSDLILVECKSKTLKGHSSSAKSLSSINEFYELLSRMSYLGEQVDSLNKLVCEENLFEFHDQSSLDKFVSNSNKQEPSDGTVDVHSAKEDNSGAQIPDYEYEYDNNSPNGIDNNGSTAYNNSETYENESDYCIIDEDEDDEAETAQVVPPGEQREAMRVSPIEQVIANAHPNYDWTLKKKEQKIKREIRLATTNADNETSRITLSDQMLLKFYLKHIEDNMNEIRTIYGGLSGKLEHAVRSDLAENSPELKETLTAIDHLAHKLALNGHKLVFICDTLHRNINNTHLKSALNDASNCLCESLKLYMIRIKSNLNSNASVLATPTRKIQSNSLMTKLNDKQHQLITDSLTSVLNASNKFKQVIIKYYFKSY